MITADEARNVANEVLKKSLKDVFSLINDACINGKFRVDVELNNRNQIYYIKSKGFTVSIFDRDDEKFYCSIYWCNTTFKVLNH